jgi:hypothetical protein
MGRQIFVFGSNLAGIHGAGSAAEAYRNHGAVWGCGIGLQGDSYAIPTKDEFLDPMSVQRIAVHVKNFIDCCNDNSSFTFNVVAIGCGLAGYPPRDIAPLFKDAPANCILPNEFREAA